MSLQNKNFALDEHVLIDNTTSVLLDGKMGTILGKAVEGLGDAYIILLDEPLPTHKAIVLVEACIFRV